MGDCRCGVPFFGWIGFALGGVFVVSWFSVQLIGNQRVINEYLALTVT